MSFSLTKTGESRRGRVAVCLGWAVLILVLLVAAPQIVSAQPESGGTQATEHTPGGEVNIKLPSLEQGEFLGLNGHQILMSGLVVCVLGLLFGAWSYSGVKRLPVHRSM